MEDTEANIVRLRGLPWATKEEDVVKFLEGCAITGDEQGVHIILGPDGRASGEAYVELVSPDDLKQALSKNKGHIGRRYIDVFKAKRAEMDWAVRRSGPRDIESEMEAVVRLRGLPYGCSKEEIANFFSGLEIVPNGITILVDGFGRTMGEGFVQFASVDLVEQALKKHKEMIGHRYIEVFKSSFGELMSTLTRLNRQSQRGGFGFGFGGGPPRLMDRYGGSSYNALAMTYGGGGGRHGRGVGRGLYNNGFEGFVGTYGGGDCAGPGFGGGYGGYGSSFGFGNNFSSRGGFDSGFGMRGSGNRGMKRSFIGNLGNRNSNAAYESQTGHSIHMRGLPYSATEDDIAQFFMPLNLVNICIQCNKDGRPSGDADVDFATHEEAVDAMKRHKALMQKRYIELFLRSTPNSGRPSSFRGNGLGNGCLYGGNNYTAF